MLNNRIKSIKSRNENLVWDYLSNYEAIDHMHGAYKNYASLMLGWADGRDLLRAPKFRVNFRSISAINQATPENHIPKTMFIPPAFLSGISFGIAKRFCRKRTLSLFPITG